MRPLTCRGRAALIGSRRLQRRIAAAVRRRECCGKSAAAWAGSRWRRCSAAMDLAADGRQCRAGQTANPLAARPPHFTPKAKHVIVLFCAGAVSQVDTYDYKPELIKRAGTPFDPTGKLEFFASKPGNCVPSYWPFRQHGQSGRWMSDLLPHLAGCVDDMAFIYSMPSKSAVHAPAMFMMNTGFIQPGFPSMGAWTVYGLGAKRKLAGLRGAARCARRAARRTGQLERRLFAGRVSRPRACGASRASRRSPICFRPMAWPSADAAASRQFLARLNARHAAARPGDSELEARILAYELAARLQLSAPEATDIGSETEATRQTVRRRRSGDRRFWPPLPVGPAAGRARACASCRSGAAPTTPLRRAPTGMGTKTFFDNHGLHGRIFDQPAAALLKDLK